MTVRALPVVALVAVGLAAAGCGQSADREAATKVTDRFFAAVRAGDGATACRQLSADTRKALESDERKPCRDAIGGLGIEPARPTKLELYLTNAKADLANGDSAFLSLTAEGWRLSAVGLQAGRRSADRIPMDCGLEA